MKTASRNKELVAPLGRLTLRKTNMI